MVTTDDCKRNEVEVIDGVNEIITFMNRIMLIGDDEFEKAAQYEADFSGSHLTHLFPLSLHHPTPQNSGFHQITYQVFVLGHLHYLAQLVLVSIFCETYLFKVYQWEVWGLINLHLDSLVLNLQLLLEYTCRCLLYCLCETMLLLFLGMAKLDCIFEK